MFIKEAFVSLADLISHTANRALTLCLAVFALLSLVSCDFNRGTTIAPGQALPQLKLVDLNGEELSLSKTRGKVLLINFWASWCTPCIQEFSEFDSLLESSSGEKLEIVAIAADDSLENVQAVVNRVNPKFRIVYDATGKIKSLFKVRAYPETFFIKPDGNFALFPDPQSGPTLKIKGTRPWSSSEYLSIFKSYLEQAK